MSKVLYKYDPETPGDHWPGIPARDLTEDDVSFLENQDLVRELAEKGVTYRSLTDAEKAEQDKMGDAAEQQQDKMGEQVSEEPKPAAGMRVKKVDDAVSTGVVDAPPVTAPVEGKE